MVFIQCRWLGIVVFIQKSSNPYRGVYSMQNRPNHKELWTNQTSQRYFTSCNFAGAMEGFEGDIINTPFAVE